MEAMAHRNRWSTWWLTKFLKYGFPVRYVQ
jgi:hypothetical protein